MMKCDHLFYTLNHVSLGNKVIVLCMCAPSFVITPPRRIPAYKRKVVWLIAPVEEAY